MKRLFINFSQRLVFALRNPRYTMRSLTKEVLATEERFLAEISGSSVASVRGYLEEPFQDVGFYGHLRQSEHIFGEAKITSADFYAKKVVLQYALVRSVKPEMILETGVASGVSTAYILLALKENGRGTLNSIELGDAAYLPPGRPPGWMVPEWLRDRWKMHIGDSRALLAPLAREFAPLDIFIHDSLHTYDHMMFEFAEAFPFLRPGGILIADDALWNPAFNEFSTRVRAPKASIVRGVGVLRKGDR
jgi:predicted O-methyltransferase YrrM